MMSLINLCQSDTKYHLYIRFLKTGYNIGNLVQNQSKVHDHNRTWGDKMKEHLSPAVRYDYL